MFRLKEERIIYDKKLGSGAYGSVYPYQKEPCDLKWVVKRMHADDCDKLLSFLEEIVLGFSCDHPCILPLKGYSIEKFGQRGYYVYLKFPRMKETLKDKFDQQKRNNQPFPEEEIVKYFYSMVCGIEYLHKKNIYHRDIKPANVLLDEKGNAMLSDIGVAKHVEDGDKYQPLTGQGGTINYTAPELLKDKSKLPKESLIAGDVWSLGLVMLELCMLDTKLWMPYATQGEIEEVQKNSYDQLKQTYSAALVELIFRLLKFEPKERIQIFDLKKELEIQYKFCLGLENNDYSQFQNQLKEYQSFLDKLQLEVLKELQISEHPTFVETLENFYKILKEFRDLREIPKFQEHKEFPLEVFRMNNQEQESRSKKINMSQSVPLLTEFLREENKESDGLIGKRQNVALRRKISGRNKFISQYIEKVDDSVKLVVVGFGASGKTCFSERLAGNPYPDFTLPTKDAEFSKLVLKRDKKKLAFNLWDTTGNEKSLETTGMYMKESQVLIIIYDLTDRMTFDRIPELIDLVNEDPEHFPILFIVGNKLDLDNERIVSKKEAEELASKHGGISVEVSAKTGENVHELRDEIADVVWEKHSPSLLSKPTETIAQIELLTPSPTEPKAKKSSFWSLLEFNFL